MANIGVCSTERLNPGSSQILANPRIDYKNMKIIPIKEYNKNTSDKPAEFESVR